MAKILCALSGISYSCDHFPITLTSRESYHPVFDIPQKKLISMLASSMDGTFTQTDSYLYFLALLKSTDLVDFRVPAFRTEHTPAILANLTEPLVKAILRINTVPITKQHHFARYVVTVDTRTLDNVDFWIRNWISSYNDYASGSRRDETARYLVDKESALERLIKNPHNPITKYISKIADWAAIAAEFPEYIIKNPYSITPTTKGQYWKDIIIRCASDDGFYNINPTALDEIIDHCETNIPIGTIYSSALFKLLESANAKMNSLERLGDKDITKTTFSILSASTSMEDAQLLAVISAAPESEPTRNQYKSNFEFMRAKMRWDMKNDLGKNIS